METQNENQEIINEKIVNPSKLVMTTYHNIFSELKVRGVKAYSIDEFVQDLFSNVKDTFKDDVINERTPFEYRLKQALSDESKKAAILKIIEHHK